MARALGADLNQQRVFFRLDSIMFECETRGQSECRPNWLTPTRFPLSSGPSEFPFAPLIIHRLVGAVEDRFQRQAARLQAQSGSARP